MAAKVQAPDGWRIVRLGDVAAVNRGTSWSRAQESSIQTDDAIPVVRIGNVQRDGFRLDDVLYIRGVSASEKSRRSITNRTLVMVGSNGNRDRVGNIFLADQQVQGHLLASFLIGIAPAVGTSERFLAASLRSAQIQSLITESTAGSTGLKNLSLTWLRNLPLLLPPLPEQRAIAAVLDGIDDAIERSEAVIAATERLRDALLHNLLTLGIPGWHSEWRDVPGLGTVPALWEVVRLGDVCAPPEYGAGAPARSFDPNLPRYVRITDLTDDGRLRSDDARSAEPSRVAGYELEPGDLLFARSGATVGKTYMYRPSDGSCVYAGYLIRFKARTAIVLPEFLELCTRSEYYRRWVVSMLRAGAQPNINAVEYSSLLIPLPSLAEQRAITEALDSTGVAIKGTRREQDRLQALKAAAAAALLTGRVRVPFCPSSSTPGDKDVSEK